jgi:hypothetical protein
MPGSGSALPRPAVRWSLAIAITGLLTVVSAPGDGLPPLALCAGIVVAAAALLPVRAAALVASEVCSSRSRRTFSSTSP